MGMRRAVSRRAFLGRSAALLGGGLVLDLGGCGDDTPDETGPDAWPDKGVAGPDEVVLGLYPRARIPSAVDAVREACKHVDFGWLGKGESVFVKVASNSNLPHPAVTSPDAVRAMVQELRARGAGKILVGDQAGVESVRLVARGRFSSTQEVFADNGLGAAVAEAGAEAHFFDDQGWDGYVEATLPAGSHWKLPLRIAKVVTEVDHIVYLPRLSSHAIAGCTHALKMAVGWLRDDSRNHLHHDAATFYEKYAEISYAKEIADRLRLTLTLADDVLLDFGPDTGTVAAADPRVVIASRSLAGHEAVSAALLVHIDELTAEGPEPHYDAGTANTLNQLFVTQYVQAATGLPWGPGAPADYTALVPHAFEKGLGDNAPLARAWEITGGRPAKIGVLSVAEPPSAALVAALAAHGEGSFVLA
jgi:uncharacterized protein (DUF362 family)